MMKRNLKTCTNSVWGDAAHTCILCTAEFVEVAGAHPFAATASDPELHGQDLFKRLVAGEFGPIAPFVAPPSSPSPPSAARKAQSPSAGTNKA